MAATVRRLDQVEGLSTLRAARLLATHDALAAEAEGLEPFLEDVPAKWEHDGAADAARDR